MSLFSPAYKYFFLMETLGICLEYSHFPLTNVCVAWLNPPPHKPIRDKELLSRVSLKDLITFDYNSPTKGSIMRVCVE